jgi:hypothetical protein
MEYRNMILFGTFLSVFILLTTSVIANVVNNETYSENTYYFDEEQIYDTEDVKHLLFQTIIDMTKDEYLLLIKNLKSKYYNDEFNFLNGPFDDPNGPTDGKGLDDFTDWFYLLIMGPIWSIPMIIIMLSIFGFILINGPTPITDDFSYKLFFPISEAFDIYDVDGDGR